MIYLGSRFPFTWARGEVVQQGEGAWQGNRSPQDGREVRRQDGRSLCPFKGSPSDSAPLTGRHLSKALGSPNSTTEWGGTMSTWASGTGQSRPGFTSPPSPVPWSAGLWAQNMLSGCLSTVQIRGSRVAPMDPPELLGVFP